MVIVLAFYSVDPSSNPAGVYNFSVKILLKRMKINEKRMGMAHFLLKKEYRLSFAESLPRFETTTNIVLNGNFGRRLKRYFWNFNKTGNSWPEWTFEMSLLLFRKLFAKKKRNKNVLQQLLATNSLFYVQVWVIWDAATKASMTWVRWTLITVGRESQWLWEETHVLKLVGWIRRTVVHWLDIYTN